MGPNCEVQLDSDDGAALDGIDAVLARAAEQIERTRKGRVWDLWIGGRPVHVSVDGSPPTVFLSAGCNDPEDYAMLRSLAEALARNLGGTASEPVK
ncbi:MAG: hypothetical protein WCJ09_13130 [Planctomycetota bacterium]